MATAAGRHGAHQLTAGWFEGADGSAGRIAGGRPADARMSAPLAWAGEAWLSAPDEEELAQSGTTVASRHEGRRAGG